MDDKESSLFACMQKTEHRFTQLKFQFNSNPKQTNKHKQQNMMFRLLTVALLLSATNAFAPLIPSFKVRSI